MNARVRTALRLGRVSNLPTVWTNVLAGLALSGASRPDLTLPLAGALSLFYVGGMYLNDAFDHRWDAQHRPERPIPSGEISAPAVFAAGFALLAVGLAVLAAIGTAAALGGIALAVLIVFYDAYHKQNPLAPLVMGLCRVAVYAIAALAAAGRVPTPVIIGSAVLLAYLVALSALARRETEDPRWPRLVGLLIAGIALLDAAVLVALGRYAWAVACLAAFALTRRLQRLVAGT